MKRAELVAELLKHGLKKKDLKALNKYELKEALNMMKKVKGGFFGDDDDDEPQFAKAFGKRPLTDREMNELNEQRNREESDKEYYAQIEKMNRSEAERERRDALDALSQPHILALVNSNRPLSPDERELLNMLYSKAYGK